MKLVWLVSLLLALPLRAAELGPLSLESALKEALQHSPEIEKAKAVVEEKRWSRFEALGSGFLPKVSVSGRHYFNPTYSQTSIAFGGPTPTIFPGFYPNTAADLTVILPLFDGLANVHHYQAASLVEDAAERELSRAEFQVSEEVRLAFYKALAAAELKAVAAQNVKTLEDHMKQVKIQRSGGVATNYDSLRVEVQLSEARADALDSEDNAELTRRKLTLLLGQASDDRPLVGVLPVPSREVVQNLDFKEAPKHRDDIQAMNLRAEAAGKLETAESVWLVPSVFLEGQYTIYDAQLVSGTTVSNTGTYKSAYGIGLMLRWNLFDGGVALAKAKEAAGRSIQAEKTSQIAKLQVPYDFAYWKRRYLSNTDHYISKKFDITRSEESVRLATEGARAGTRTATETLDAELDLFRARAGVVNAQVNAAEARIRLELAMGRSL